MGRERLQEAKIPLTTHHPPTPTHAPTHPASLSLASGRDNCQFGGFLSVKPVRGGERGGGVGCVEWGEWGVVVVGEGPMGAHDKADLRPWV